MNSDAFEKGLKTRREVWVLSMWINQSRMRMSSTDQCKSWSLNIAGTRFGIVLD